MKTEKTYREIKFGAGDNIKRAVQDLQRYKDRGELVYGIFNGKKLYSDVDDLNSAYQKITGKTKEEYDELEKKQQHQYDEKKRMHKQAIPQLTKEWIYKGNKILDEKYQEKWAKVVPFRLKDLYEGMELGATLEIVKVLNRGGKLSKAKEIIKKQGHSGMSYSLVCSMVKSFCDRGNEFVSFVR